MMCGLCGTNAGLCINQCYFFRTPATGLAAWWSLWLEVPDPHRVELTSRSASCSSQLASELGKKLATIWTPLEIRRTHTLLSIDNYYGSKQ